MIEQIIYRRVGKTATDPGGLRITELTPGASKVGGYFAALYNNKLGLMPYNSKLNADSIHSQSYARAEDMLTLTYTCMDQSGSRTSRVSHGLLLETDRRINALFGCYPLMTNRFIYMPGYSGSATQPIQQASLTSDDGDFDEAVAELSKLFRRYGEEARVWLTYLFEALIAIGKRNMDDKMIPTKILLRMPRQDYELFSESTRLLAELLYALLPGTLGKWISYVSYSSESENCYSGFDLRFVGPAAVIPGEARTRNVIFDLVYEGQNAMQDAALSIRGAAPGVFAAKLAGCVLRGDNAALRGLRALLHEPGTAASEDAPAEVFGDTARLTLQADVLAKLWLREAGDDCFAKLSPDERVELMREYGMVLSGRRPLFAQKLHALMVQQIPALPALIESGMLTMENAELIFRIADQAQRFGLAEAEPYLCALCGQYTENPPAALLALLGKYPALQAELANRVLSTKVSTEFSALPGWLREFLLSNIHNYSGATGQTDPYALASRAFENGWLSGQEQALLVQARANRFQHDAAESPFDQQIAARLGDNTLAGEAQEVLRGCPAYAQRLTRIALQRQPRLTFEGCAPLLRQMILALFEDEAEGAQGQQVYEVLLGALQAEDRQWANEVTTALERRLAGGHEAENPVLAWLKAEACAGRLAEGAYRKGSALSRHLVERILSTETAIDAQRGGTHSAVRAVAMELFARLRECRAADAVVAQVAAWYPGGMSQAEQRDMLVAVRAQKHDWGRLELCFKALARAATCPDVPAELSALFAGVAPEDQPLRQQILGAMDDAGRMTYACKRIDAMNLPEAVVFYGEYRGAKLPAGSALDDALERCAERWSHLDALQRAHDYPELRGQLFTAGTSRSALKQIDRYAFANDAIATLDAIQRGLNDHVGDGEKFPDLLRKYISHLDAYIMLYQTAGLCDDSSRAMELNKACVGLYDHIEKVPALSEAMWACLASKYELLCANVSKQKIDYALYPVNLLLREWKETHRADAKALGSMAVLAVLLHGRINKGNQLYINSGEIHRELQTCWGEIQKYCRWLQLNNKDTIPPFVLDVVRGYRGGAEDLISLSEQNTNYTYRRFPYRATKLMLILLSGAFLAEAVYACTELLRML